jgi:hypothetical protein
MLLNVTTSINAFIITLFLLGDWIRYKMKPDAVFCNKRLLAHAYCIGAELLRAL